MAKAGKTSEARSDGADPDPDGYVARTVSLDEGRVEFTEQQGETVPPGIELSQSELPLEGPTRAEDVMTEGVKTAAPETDLAAVATIMRDEKVGIVPIVDRGRLVGVITDRDIVVRVDAEAAPVDLVRAADVMTTGLITVRPEDDLMEVIDRMGQEGLQRILVADDDARLLGIISVSDLARRTDLPERVQDTLDQIARHRA
jgi:CBS domain-containing protein